MLPWERRLRDLAQLLSNCGQTYFNPDLFRLNTNQFLQTARTVTFIIQKNKSQIPTFDAWYDAAVVTPWSTDQLMIWAKDSRNVIEKQGDLELHSTLRASLLFSHIPSQDQVITTSRPELLAAGVDKLLRVAASKLPRGIADAAVLRIDRRWVANSLPTHELLFALTYIYGRHFAVVQALACQLKTVVDASVPHPTTLDPTHDQQPRTHYIKFGQPGIGRLQTTRLRADQGFKPSPELIALKSEFATAGRPSSLADVVQTMARMAELTFNQYGNHVPMLFLFDDNWRQLDFLSTQFADQADKFVFWRHAAERAGYLRAYALVWISETWLRDMKEPRDLPMKDLPIVGEHLNVVGATVDGEERVVSWSIRRDTPEAKPLLVSEDRTRESGAALTVFFAKPVLEAMKAARGSGAG